VRTVGVKLTVDASQYVSGLQRAKAATTGFKGELENAAKKGNLDAVTDQAAGVGLALVGMAGYAIKSAADFDKSMSAVSAATHASADDMGKLRAAALQAGKDTQYSATQAADGITELSKAGVSTADVLGGGLKGALALAAAGQMSVSEASETAASAMTQFKLKGDQIPHVADLLAAGAGKAQGSVHDMGAALNQSGLVAAQFGLSIEETTGGLAEFAHAGLIGSDAGTSMKTMLLAIANPSSVSAKLMQNLGISFYDAQGKFVGLGGVAEVLRQKLGGLTDQQRQQALGQLFGNDAIRAASILYTDGAKGVAEWKNKVNDAGYASETAAKLTDNLAGDLERLKGSMETLAIQGGSGANDGLRSLVKILNTLVNRFIDLPPVVGSVLTVVAGLSGAALLGAAAWVKYRKVVADAREQLEAIGPSGEKASAMVGKTTAVLGRAGAVLGGFQIASMAASAALGTDLNPRVEALGKSLGDMSSAGKVSGEAARLFGGDLGMLDTAMKDVADTGRWSTFARGFGGTIESLTGTGDVFSDSIQHSKERLSSLDQALQQMVSGGNAAGAAEVFQTIADRAQKQGVSVKELKAVLPGYASAVENAGSASKTAAGKTGDLNSALSLGQAAQDGYKTKAASVAGVLRGETDALIALSKQLKAGTDPLFAFVTAQDSMTKAQKEATKAVRDHGAKSIEARAANEKLVTAALELQGAAGKVAGTFNGKLDPALVATLKAGGLTEKQIQAVSKEFRQAKTDAEKYDGKYQALTTAPGAVQSKKQLNEAWAQAKAYDGNYNGITKAPGAVQAKRELNDAYTAANHFAGPYMAKSSAPGAVQAKKELDLAYTSANHFDGPYRAISSAPGATTSEKQLANAWAQAKGFDGNYNAHATVTGVPGVKSQLASLLIQQEALKKGIPISAAAAAYRKNAFSEGGWTGPGSKYQPAGVVHADEFVIQKESRQKIEAKAPGLLDKMNATGHVPGYASGGAVWPFRTSAAMTRIPSKSEALDRHSYGTLYQNRRTDNGNWSWHSDGRAVDFGGYNQDKLAQFFLARQSQVLELIHRTKSRDYGVSRGRTHAMPHEWPLHRNHLHVAMKAGGTINEPIMGVGQSGRTYSFGENYQPERVVPNWQPGGSDSGPGGGMTTVNVTVNAPIGSHPREIGRQVVDTIGAYLQSGGELRVQGQKVF
jgi:TP901 family phage tail tape measure protein